MTSLMAATEDYRLRWLVREFERVQEKRNTQAYMTLSMDEYAALLMENISLHQRLTRVETMLGDAAMNCSMLHPQPILFNAANQPPIGQTADRSITCPKCGRTSYNAQDITQRYCGNCHQYHDEMERS